MNILVTYDINVTTKAGEKRLRQVAKICENHGLRVQNSVFECLVYPAIWEEMRKQLETVIDHERDSLRYYYLGSNWQRRVEHIGAKETFLQDDPLIF